MATWTPPGRAGSSPWIRYGPTARPAPRPRSRSDTCDGCGSCLAPSSASSPGRPTSKQLMFGTWHYWWQAHLLDCLVDAQVRDPQPDRQAADRTADPRAPAAQHRLGQRLLRRHGLAGARAGAGRQARRGGAAEGAAHVGRAVPQRMGARGRRRHPVAQAGPVLQRACQRARRHLPGPLRRPASGAPSRWPTGSTRP